MKINELYKSDKKIFSFEVFPPKPEMPIDTIYRTIDEIKHLNPSFISVTYGAGGSNRSRTIELSSYIKNQLGIEALSHLTCVASSKEEISSILDNLKNNSIENILALRGDPPKDIQNFDFSTQEFKHASDLISHIAHKEHFCIGASCYPEAHIESSCHQEDIKYLKLKVDSGVSFLISQLFFDNNIFISFLDEIRKADINCPVSAGIMPILNSNQIKRMTLMCGASIPKKLIRILNRYEHNPDDMIKAGIHYAIEQIHALKNSTVNGFHIYTMNRPDIVKEIMKNI
ncbi:MAG: methylenetetrahydrofolate reductase [NAD(P)H] [Deltaproteobacteria bacterium]